ncbi:telomere repeats-binding bouquet formation protein 1-like isoform X2 [Clytia hemisphaerica]
MNKPRNVENQIVCSRLLNLALSTLASGKYAEDARIEALQFIADCLYENEKTQNIFNMIGGMRILSQVLKTEMKNECDNKAKRNLELTKTLLDTVTVAVTDHTNNKASGLKNDLMSCLVACLQSEKYDQLHLKVFLCFSELVHKNESCQKALVTSNGVPEIINIMSKKQDDMISKIGTSILQQCVKYQDDLDDCVKSGQKQVIEKDDIQMENTNHSKLKKNVRRAKRSLPMNDICQSINDQKATNTVTNVDSKDNTEMIDMLKSQHDLLQKFQDEIKNLRAEVRSQAASECGFDQQATMTPSRGRTQMHYYATPSRRLYPRLCPDTAPSKRQCLDAPSASWTPQRHDMSRLTHGSTTPSVQMLDKTPQRKYPDEGDDDVDERPALKKKTHSSTFCEEESTPSSSFMMKQQSLFEKVQLWQKQNEHNLNAPLPQIDKDGFVMPTPMVRRIKVKENFMFKTPMVNGQKMQPTIQCAPKKKEATKKRCPTSSDEGFYDQNGEGDSSGEVVSGIRRTLSFDHSRNEDEASVICHDEQKAPVTSVSNTATKINKSCVACRPDLSLNSKNLIQFLEQKHFTCRTHFEFLKKIQKLYDSVKRKERPAPVLNNATTKILPQPTFPMKTPKKRLDTTNTDWENTSVFSYRSIASRRSHASERSDVTYRTNMMTPSRRRQRKEYTAEEVNYIIDGAERYGRRWKMVLDAYPFQNGRTAIDLKDKYKKLKIYGTQPTPSRPVPFTTQELVNLKHGVSKFGQQWPRILKGYNFEGCRTPYDLQMRWATLMKNV